MSEGYDAYQEAAWEVQAARRAVLRYRESAQHRQAHELPPGRRALVETVEPVATAIERLRKTAVAGVGGGGGKPADWWAPILAFDADVLAVIAVATALRVPPARGYAGPAGQPLPTFSRRVCSALRDQADHDAFVAGQKAEAKAGRVAAEAAGMDPNKAPEGGLLRIFKAAHPNADRRAWARFAGRVQAARSSSWPEDTMVKVGAALAQALSEGAPEWFEVKTAGPGPANRNPLCVVLTDQAVARMQDIAVRSEVARPMLLPMIVPPNPWQYAPNPQKEAA